MALCCKVKNKLVLEPLHENNIKAKNSVSLRNIWEKDKSTRQQNMRKVERNIAGHAEYLVTFEVVNLHLY